MDGSHDHHPVTLFGLPATRGRWLLIPLGMAVLLCLGTVYSWSIFRKPLEAELAIGATQSLLPYTVALVCYATLMPMAGFYMLRIGPRLMTALVGLSAIGISSPVGAATPMPFTLWPCWLWWALGWPPGY